MKRPILNVLPRERTGKSPLKKLRNEGFIPAVLYARGQASQNIRLDVKQFEKEFAFKGNGASVDLDFGGEVKMAVVKHIEKNYLKGKTVHVEFQQMRAGEKITLELPLHLTHRDNVEKNGLIVQQLADMIEIETIPQYLVDSVSVDVSHLTLDQPIHIEDLPIFKDSNFRVLTEGQTVIAQLSYPAKITSDMDESDEEAEGLEEEVATEE